MVEGPFRIDRAPGNLKRRRRNIAGVDQEPLRRHSRKLHRRGQRVRLFAGAAGSRKDSPRPGYDGGKSRDSLANMVEDDQVAKETSLAYYCFFDQLVDLGGRVARGRRARGGVGV